MEQQSSPESGSDETDEHSALFDKFKAHIISLDGGLRSEETAAQHVRQISTIIQAHGLDIFQDITLLMEPGGYLHRNWKSPTISGRREWRVGTMRAYLYSIRLFLIFCQAAGQYVSEELCKAGVQLAG